MRPNRSPGTVQLSLACLSPLSTTRPGPRRDDPGRRERIRHMAAVLMFWSGEYRPEEVAALFQVSRMTLYRWAKLVMTYDDPEAIGLRRLLADRGAP